MELKKLRCPECGANFESDEKVSFCSHCGAKLYFDDGTRNINYNYNYKTEDVTKIKEVEANKEIKMQENNIVSKKQGLLYILLFIAFFIILIISVIMNNYIFLSLIIMFAAEFIIIKFLFNDVEKQKKELQNIVNEIYTDIKAGHYEVALMKTKSLHYTANASIEDKKKWDDTRESLIKIIEEKMK